MTDLAARMADVRGANYVPSTAVNNAQFWQEFDEATIDHELGLGEELGLNSMRVFLQYLVFEHDPETMIKNFDRFCALAERHRMSVLPVLFDDCFAPEPALGPYPDPVPDRHNSRWCSSPGRTRMGLDHRPALRRYVEALVGGYGGDPRVLAWEIYNEPKSEPPTVALQRDAFGWARRLNPDQPLTACWSGVYLSDVMNVHLYTSPSEHPAEVQRIIESAESFEQPVLVTEFLGRPHRGTLQETLPLFAEHGFGWYFWELMIGRTQVDLPWPRDRENHPDGVAFQGLLYPDGTPYDPEEIDLIRAHTGATAPAVSR